ncbi:bifunctional aminoglycoside phosphotransferase/ATP-binding protein [Antarctobacter jejuensis]|uniref:bifunctional aminoglycoside phosphotransferase/ATP-binding protein n=1 Tax=Antarctobacter jejuensis TaxID=1439938 RepID=UPI003FCF3459
MPEQDEVVSFVSQPMLYPDAGTVELVQTHGAFVFLGGKVALKIKRAVRYDYLDYSTLPGRKAALERELELNAPFAPTIYRDLVPITRTSDGGLALDGDGETVEWALRMWRFPDEDQLDRVAARGALGRRVAERLGSSVARYHADAPVHRAPKAAWRIGDILDELEREFAGMADALPQSDTDDFLTRAREALTRHAGLLDARAVAGQVRRCHGDLHLRNIVLLDGVPVPFDALEFSEELGTCDVLYDLAFLLMDLLHRNLPEAANTVLNSYLFSARADLRYAGLAALPLFLAVRAGISAMVAVQSARAQQDSDPAPEEARGYLREACAFMTPRPARLLAIGGLSGTGKTTLARGLAPDLGAGPGAVHLRSDTIRKALFGVDPQTRLDDSHYRPEISAQVYHRLDALARMALEAGQSVIVDAVFLKPAERAAIEAVAARCGAGFTGLWLEASPAVLESRVTARHEDASDADADVVRAQLTIDPGEMGWIEVDASGQAAETLTHARRALSGDASTNAPYDAA